MFLKLACTESNNFITKAQIKQFLIRWQKEITISRTNLLERNIEVITITKSRK